MPKVCWSHKGFDSGAKVNISLILGGPNNRLDSIFEPGGLVGAPGATGIDAGDSCHTFTTPTSLGDEHGEPLHPHVQIALAITGTASDLGVETTRVDYLPRRFVVCRWYTVSRSLTARWQLHPSQSLPASTPTLSCEAAGASAVQVSTYILGDGCSRRSLDLCTLQSKWSNI